MCNKRRFCISACVQHVSALEAWWQGCQIPCRSLAGSCKWAQRGPRNAHSVALINWQPACCLWTCLLFMDLLAVKWNYLCDDVSSTTGANGCFICSAGYCYVFCPPINHHYFIHGWMDRQSWSTPCPDLTYSWQCIRSCSSSLSHVPEMAYLLPVHWWISAWYLWILHNYHLSLHVLCGRYNRGVQNCPTIGWVLCLTAVDIIFWK